MNRGENVFSFKDEKDMRIERLEKKNKLLENELSSLRSRSRATTQINTFMNKAAIKDDLFKVLFQYLKELVDIIGTPSPDIDLKTIKIYFEDLFNKEIRVEFFIGENLYKKAYEGDIGEKDDAGLGELAEEDSIRDLYNLTTTNTLDIQKILSNVEAKEGLTELTRVKFNNVGLAHYHGVALWVMERHLQQYPGFVIFMLEEEHFLTPVQKEVIGMFMTMIQPIINNKISLGRLSEAAKNAERVAYTDAMTNIPNRTKFNDDYMYNERKTKHTVVYIDLCKLKQINDVHGHQVADGVIIEFARQIKEYATTYGGEAYRIGGDEFVAILPPTTRNSELIEGTKTFQNKYHDTEFTNEQGIKFKTHASIGVQINRCGSLDRDEVVNRADKLMYESKSDRNNYPIKYSWIEDKENYEDDNCFGFQTID